MPESPLFTGQIIDPASSPHASFLFPLVQVQKAYKALFHLIIKLFWDELIYNKKIQNELVSLGLFVLFLLLSTFTYSFKPYLPILVFLSFSLWFTDYYLARKKYESGQERVPVTLTGDDEGKITLSVGPPAGKPSRSEFIAGQVAGVRIGREVVRGGAFQERMGKVWRVELRLWGGSQLIVHEHRDLVNTFHAAGRLGELFAVNVIFADSQGYGNPVEESLEGTAPGERSSLWIQKKKDRVHLMTRWRWQNTRSLLGQIFQDSGFSLFVVLMTNFMSNLGKTIDSIVTAFNRGGEETVIYLPDLFRGVTHDFDPIGFVNLSVAVAWMVYRGWRLSRAKHVTIDKYGVKYAIDNHRVDRLKTSAIEAVFLIRRPDLALVILGRDRALVLEEFQRLEDCQAFLGALHRAIAPFAAPATEE